MTRTLRAEPLTAAGFAPFGQVLEATGAPTKRINRGLCGRWHDLAAIDITSGRVGVSIFDAEPRDLPYTLDLLERHPDGSQAFLPMTEHPFRVTVAPDANGKPGAPLAFLTTPGQGINLARGTWHGVLTPLQAPGRFAVIDRIGDGANLEEVPLDPPWIITG